jgi:hypothetical protein
MASEGACSDEKTIRYLLSVIKSCADFQPDFTQVARDFEIATSRPRIDALVTFSFASGVLFSFLFTFSPLHSSTLTKSIWHFVYREVCTMLLPTASEADQLKFACCIMKNSDMSIRWQKVADEWGFSLASSAYVNTLSAWHIFLAFASALVLALDKVCCSSHKPQISTHQHAFRTFLFPKHLLASSSSPFHTKRTPRLRNGRKRYLFPFDSLHGFRLHPSLA